MRINLYTRKRAKASELNPLSTFKKMTTEQNIYVVIDMTKVDGFNQEVTLREDVIYCLNMMTGCLEIVQKALEVEVIDLVCSEFIAPLDGDQQ